MGAFQIWGENSLAGKLCRRWLEMITGTWKDAGKAEVLALAGGPSISRLGVHRAGTRPAPTGAFGGVDTVG